MIISGNTISPGCVLLATLPTRPTISSHGTNNSPQAMNQLTSVMDSSPQAYCQPAILPPQKQSPKIVSQILYYLYFMC